MISLPFQANCHRLRCDRALPACSNCRCRPEIEACLYTHRGAEAGGAGSRTALLYRPAGEYSVTNASTPNDRGTESSESLQTKITRLEKTIDRLICGRGDVEPQTSTASYNSSAYHTVQDHLRTTHGLLEATQPFNFSLPTSSAAATSPITSATAGNALWATLLDEVCAIVGSFSLTDTPRGHSP